MSYGRRIEPGERFGMLVVVKRLRLLKSGHTLVECLCDCGASVLKGGGTLRAGDTRSCGCLGAEASRRNLVKATAARVTRAKARIVARGAS